MCPCRSLVIGTAAAVAAGAILASLAAGPSQSGKKTPPDDVMPPTPTVPAPKVPGAQEVPMTPEMAAAMATMSPGPEHLWLAEKVGSWTFTGQMWMGPGTTIDVRGTSNFRMLLGGRYLAEDLKMTMMGEPYEGVGTTGFSRGTKQFQMTWIDSAGTHMTNGSGTRSSDGKTLTATYEMFDPMIGKVIKSRSVETRIDPNTFTFAMFGPGPEGKEVQMFEFRYTRSPK